MERGQVWEESNDSPERRSFDLTASVNMLRYDYAHHGQALPETERRILDEELSFMAEAAGRPARTNYVLGRGENDELLYFNRGKWSPYMGMLRTGLEVAREEAAQDYRRAIFVTWAERDEAMGYKMRSLQPGERLSWTNSYPHEVEAQYGKDFAQSCGLNPERKMGFLYQAVCHQDGAIELITQTVDRSDPEAFTAVEQAVQHDPELDIDGMVRVYDGRLRQRDGGHYYAGSREAERYENVWKQILQQQDLTTYYLRGLQEIAQLNLYGQRLETAVRRHVIGAWTLFKQRLDGELPSHQSNIEPQTWGAPMSLPQDNYYVMQQMAYQNMQSHAFKNKPMVGCGGVIELQASGELMDMTMEDARDSVFGNDDKPEQYSFSKFMYCVVCQAPPKEKESKRMCGPCGICKHCDTKIQSKSAAGGILALVA